jgi:hypothetical protein
MSLRRTAVAATLLTFAAAPAAAQVCPVGTVACATVDLVNSGRAGEARWDILVTFVRTGFLEVSPTKIWTEPGVPTPLGGWNIDVWSDVVPAGGTWRIQTGWMGGFVEGARYRYPLAGWFLPEGDPREWRSITPAYGGRQGLEAGGVAANTVTFTTSPEPAGWALMAGGLAAVFGVARGRRRPTG